ncbi:hypothetical protein ACLMJK_002863 [Lecanora helva]
MTALKAQLTTAVSCKSFLCNQDPREIAKHIRNDQSLCNQGSLPSILAYYLPRPSTGLGERIARHLFPEHSISELRAMQYTGIVDMIKAYLAQMDHEPPEEEQEPYQDEINIAITIRTIRHLQAEAILNPGSTVSETLEILQKSLPSNQETAVSPPPTKRFTNRLCYICRLVLVTPHPLYPSLCEQCGSFNLAESSISLPESLDLAGKTAVVTGGRVNLGFHTALRLLRCGANVIVSTRYPHDAEVRYLEEPDSDIWHSRLRVVGADFRRAKDVFGLVSDIRQILEEWGKSSAFPDSRLDILINNAAQTLTDPISAEKQAIQRESSLKTLTNRPATLVQNLSSYEATIRGGSRMLGGLLELPEASAPESIVGSYTSLKTSHLPDNNISTLHESDDTLTLQPSKSSWLQTLPEIPYDDLITAHSINTFAPLILIRELLPLLHRQKSEELPSHIINVSSREGIFEPSPKSSAKGGHHVHTNMSKAALNMITETEAEAAWRNGRVAMNSVDPGFMSAAPEVRGRRGECPIGFGDGAARVVWPVARAERGEGVMWGRFLKHFGRVEVEVGVGR